MRSFLEEQRDHQLAEAKSEECKIDSLNTIYLSKISKTNSFQSFGNNHGYEESQREQARLHEELAQ